MYFLYFFIIALGKGQALVNPLYSMTICIKFGWNWSSSSGEEDENVTFLQTNGQMDQQMDDQKSSFELKKVYLEL